MVVVRKHAGSYFCIWHRKTVCVRVIVCVCVCVREREREIERERERVEIFQKFQKIIKKRNQFLFVIQYREFLSFLKHE